MRAVNANAYCDCDSYNTTIPVTYTIDTGIAYPDDTTIPNANTYGNRFTDAYAYCNRSTQGNTKASSDSASSAVRIG
jgi:hypothetical protein